MKKVLAVVTSFFVMAFGSAHAAITALDMAPIQTDVEATITNITPAVLAVLAVVLGVTIGIKLVKKLIGSGT